MSRHRNFRGFNPNALSAQLDLDDEDIEEDLENELSVEDEEQLFRGTAEVRRALGQELPISDHDIRDSLYYYYYDVPKTIKYILNKHTPKTKPNLKPTNKTVSDQQAYSELLNLSDAFYGATRSCDKAQLFSPEKFFKDVKWFAVPPEQRAEITVESLLPRGRLLGGSSSQAGPPRSKLAALAAARKKENRDQGKNTALTSSVTILDRLKQATPSSDPVKSRSLDGPADLKEPLSRKLKKYPTRKRRTSTRQNEELSRADVGTIPSASNMEPRSPSDLIPKASPSVFAEVILGPSSAFFQVSRNTLFRSTTNVRENNIANIEAFAGPSPDDVVLKAQGFSQDAQPRNEKDKLSTTTNTELAQGLKGVSVSNGPTKIRSRNMDVAAEYAKRGKKRAANFVVIGHVDAGKSTLMGRLLLDLNVVGQRTIDKYRKEAERVGKSSFAMAWVLDQGTEERARGVTIDIANVKFETDKTAFTLLDAPGHQDFVPNMIAGTSQADFAVLVIDASTGNFESGLKGQTKEHALLARSLGVQRIITAVNKLDTVEWSRDRFDEISQQISAFLVTAGFQKKNLAFVPCSGLSGANVVVKATIPEASWYNGETLLESLEASEPVTRAIESPLRLSIDNIFRGGVQNPLSISGRLDAGTVQLGDSVLVLPASQRSTIKAIDVDDEPQEWAVAGHNVTLHLADIDAQVLKIGDIICSVSAPVPLVKNFTLKLLAFEHIMPMHCEVVKGRLLAAGRISKLEALLDKGSGVAAQGKRLKLIKPGNVARIIVEFDALNPIESGNRVIIRAEGGTVGAGLVE